MLIRKVILTHRASGEMGGKSWSIPTVHLLAVLHSPLCLSDAHQEDPSCAARREAGWYVTFMESIVEE